MRQGRYEARLVVASVSQPDHKPVRRIKDSALIRNFSLRAASCGVCGEGRAAGLDPHHVYPRGRGGDGPPAPGEGDDLLDRDELEMEC